MWLAALLALGPTIGVGEVAASCAARPAVHDDERRRLGDGDLTVSRVAKSMKRAWPACAPRMASGSSRPTRDPAGLLGALADARPVSSGSRSRPSASRRATEKAALDERPAPMGMVLVTFMAPPDGRLGQGDEGRRQCGLRAGRGRGAAQGRISQGSGNWSLVDADQEAARPGGEAGLGGQVDGHGQREALVVVGVVTDQGDPSGCTSDPHCPSLTATGRSGHDPAMAQSSRSGPLSGIKIIELAGIGPAPYAAMMLADAGAQVIRLERAAPGAPGTGCRVERTVLGPAQPEPRLGGDRPEAPGRGRSRAAPGRAGRRADRGVPARAWPSGSGSGPDACWARNAGAGLRAHDRLGPGRAHGRRRPVTTSTTSPSAARCGPSVGPAAPPVPPLNLVGDFGGGGMLLAFGMVAALLEAARSGEGQVVDAAMVDGAASLMTMIHAVPPVGHVERASGRPTCSTRGRRFYEVYETADGKYFAVGAIETKFYAELLEGLGLAGDPTMLEQSDKADVAGHEGAVRRGVRDQDAGRVDGDLRGTDACAAPGALAVGSAICTRTTRPARPSSRSTASCNRRRRPVSAAPRPPSAARRRPRGPTPCRGWSSGESTRGRWPSCARAAR